MTLIDGFKSSFTEATTTAVSPPNSTSQQLTGRKRSAQEAANVGHFGPGKSIRDLRDPTTRKLTFSFRKKERKTVTDDGTFN